jgi:hypothetical protein
MKNHQNSQEPLSFVPRPSNHSTNSRIALEPHEKTNLPPKASKVHIFWSRAPFHMIHAPKFKEFIALLILAFIHVIVCCIIFTCLLCGLRLEFLCRSYCSRIFRSKSFKSLRFSLAGNCPLSHCTYYSPIYSIVCRNCMIVVSLRAPMLETTRTWLTIPWSPHRVEWLGHFWVELFSPTGFWSGFG